MDSRKRGEHLYFAAEIQASLWIAHESSAEMTQSTMQKPTLQQWEVLRLTHVQLKIRNWAYSGLRNKWATRQSQKYLCFSFFLFLFCIWKFRHTKYAQIIWVNRSGQPHPIWSTWSTPRFKLSWVASLQWKSSVQWKSVEISWTL